MNFIKNIFRKKEIPIQSYTEFWAWFQQHEKIFFELVQNGRGSEAIERRFFNIMGPKLDELQEGYLYLTGMYDDQTVELVLTADGNTNHIVFVEELVAAAPLIAGWKFTALKPALDKPAFGINMGGYTFNTENLQFYANEHPEYPDEIDITIVYDLFNEEDKKLISNGIHIFLDNYLGELDYVNNIDNISISGPSAGQKERIPINKLKDFLNWRYKEFVEKYEGVRYANLTDDHAIFETRLSNGNMAIATINTGLLLWENKASHPWIAKLTFKYDGNQHNGMPGDHDYQLLNKIDDDLQLELNAEHGCIYVGRETADGVFAQIKKGYNKKFDIEYDIYKDKYWQSFDRFMNTEER